MPRLQALLECVGTALVDKGRKALAGQWPWADVLHDVARAAYDAVHRKLPGPDLRLAIADAAACDAHEYDRRVGELLTELAQTHALPFKETLSDYLWAFPATIRQVLRRPSDPTGRTAPEKLAFYRAEDLLAYLPPRAPKARTGHKPGLDDWTLTELLGIGECSSVWKAEDPDHHDSPAALKFATDPETKDRVRGGAELFTKVFALNDVPGILPLRSVYLEADPPCLESPYVYGYDLAGLMFDWKWRYDAAKPEAALKLIRRLASIIAEAHRRGVVHRDLKPANVLLHPTEGGKFTMWVTDFGWGEIESVRSLELAKGGPRGEQQRLAQRGAATTLYASPQQAKREAPSPADDVHALGVIWYQMLKRDPAAAAPVGTEWVEEFRPHGFTDSQARVLQSCLATRADKRPRSAAVLCEFLAQVTLAPPVPGVDDGSKLISLKSGLSGTNLAPVAPVTSRGKVIVAEGAASQAAALLGAVGGGPITTGGPASVSSGSAKLVKNSIGMTFVRVQPGEFRMGSPPEELGRREHEGPEHPVKITKAFYVSVTPVTQAQYEKVVGRNPSKFNKAHGGGPDHPVEMVTWPDAVLFCEKLSTLHDEQVNNRHYRLPTEAEWEYACRAGTDTPWAFGDHLTGKDAVYSASGGKYGGKSTAPVGTHPANPWGLHDAHGNVNEWVSDWYEEYYYFDSPKEDPPGPARGQGKVTRGGCYNLLAADTRSAARRSHAANAASETIGFRVVMTVG